MVPFSRKRGCPDNWALFFFAVNVVFSPRSCKKVVQVVRKRRTRLQFVDEGFRCLKGAQHNSLKRTFGVLLDPEGLKAILLYVRAVRDLPRTPLGRNKSKWTARNKGLLPKSFSRPCRHLQRDSGGPLTASFENGLVFPC